VLVGRDAVVLKVAFAEVVGVERPVPVPGRVVFGVIGVGVIMLVVNGRVVFSGRVELEIPVPEGLVVAL
jgi:hypothetical protein